MVSPNLIKRQKQHFNVLASLGPPTLLAAESLCLNQARSVMIVW